MPVPSLVSILINKEDAKGSPLTEQEVLDYRDDCIVIAVMPWMIESMAESRGYDDLEYDHTWEQWKGFRAERQR